MKHWVAWLIVRNKKIFMIKRSTNTSLYPWLWAFPWWAGEEWENPENTAIREVKEEVGLDLIIKKQFYTVIYNDIKWKIKWYWFLCDCSWKVTVSEREIDWYAWYTFLEAKQLDLAFDCNDALDLLSKENLI